MADSKSTGLRFTADISASRLDALTRELAGDLRRVGIAAEIQTHAPSPGERGIASDLGMLALEFLGARAKDAAQEIAKEMGKELGKKLIEVFKAYLSRERTAKFTLTKPDGASLTIDQSSIDNAETRKAIEDLPRVAS